MDEVVERAQAVLDAGGGLDEVLAIVDQADTGTLGWLKLLREVTGCGLSDAVMLSEKHRRGISLHRIGPPQIAVMIETGRTTGPTRHAHIWFRDALVSGETTLAVHRGDPATEGFRHRWGEETPPSRRGPEDGWGTSDFDELRADLRAVAAADHALGRRLTVEDRGPDTLVLRFDLT